MQGMAGLLTGQPQNVSGKGEDYHYRLCKYHMKMGTVRVEPQTVQFNNKWRARYGKSVVK